MPKQLRRVHVTGKAKSSWLGVLSALLRKQPVIHYSHYQALRGKVKKVEVLDTGEVYYHIEPLPEGITGRKGTTIILGELGEPE